MTVADVGFWSLEAGGFLWIVVTIFWICGLVDVMTKRPDLDGRHRAAWLLIIVLFPVLGTLAYFFVRPTLPAEREQMIAARQSLAGAGRRYEKPPPVA
ncbi:MAG TPA: PLD nuclease N-terminal domain-containing protein [Solirubrobacterales bacterium]|nr:PLD nuclease N-terminal domain-containing protein [Solirubrobacterales bacterium]